MQSVESGAVRVGASEDILLSPAIKSLEMKLLVINCVWPQIVIFTLISSDHCPLFTLLARLLTGWTGRAGTELGPGNTGAGVGCQSRSGHHPAITWCRGQCH